MDKVLAKRVQQIITFSQMIINTFFYFCLACCFYSIVQRFSTGWLVLCFGRIFDFTTCPCETIMAETFQKGRCVCAFAKFRDFHGSLVRVYGRTSFAINDEKLSLKLLNNAHKNLDSKILNSAQIQYNFNVHFRVSLMIRSLSSCFLNPIKEFCNTKQKFLVLFHFLSFNSDVFYFIYLVFNSPLISTYSTVKRIPNFSVDDFHLRASGKIYIVKLKKRITRHIFLLLRLSIQFLVLKWKLLIMQ